MNYSSACQITPVGEFVKHNCAARVQAIAKAYADQPQGTIIVSPDNTSRPAINQAVRVELQGHGMLARESTPLPT